MRYDYHGILKLFFPYATIKISKSHSDNIPVWLFINKKYLRSFFAILRLSSLFARTTSIDITGYEYCKINQETYLNYIIITFLIPFWNLKLNVVTVTFNYQSIQPPSHFFPGLTWPEREISEMLGINFTKKLDARRLMLDYAFDGLPLSKNFPAIGYEEIEYDARERWLIYKPLRFRDEATV